MVKIWKIIIILNLVNMGIWSFLFIFTPEGNYQSIFMSVFAILWANAELEVEKLKGVRE